MAYLNRQEERDRLLTVLERIQLGDVVIKQGAEEIVAELQQRLAGLEDASAEALGLQHCGQSA